MLPCITLCPSPKTVKIPALRGLTNRPGCQIFKFHLRICPMVSSMDQHSCVKYSNFDHCLAMWQWSDIGRFSRFRLYFCICSNFNVLFTLCSFVHLKIKNKKNLRQLIRCRQNCRQQQRSLDVYLLVPPRAHCSPSHCFHCDLPRGIPSKHLESSTTP